MLSRRYVGSDAQLNRDSNIYSEIDLGALDSIRDQPVEKVVSLIEVPPQMLLAFSAGGNAPLVAGKPRIRVMAVPDDIAA